VVLLVVRGRLVAISGALRRCLLALSLDSRLGENAFLDETTNHGRSAISDQ
jgi:hypothetical protein